MIRTRSILLPRGVSDGLRISVMSRHTLNDGVTPHPEINSSSYDLWLRSLCPPDKLVGDCYKRGLSWEGFEERYLEHVRRPEAVSELKYIAEKSLLLETTFLCIEESPEFCHRRLLAEECKKYQPSLVLDIR